MDSFNIENNPVLNSLGLANRQVNEQEESEELGQDAFLRLMIAQLSNQNPLEPQANGEFIAQLAQFSSVEGITNLNTTVSDLASSLQSNQALQATALVGRNVVLAGDTASKANGEGVNGLIALPQSTSQLTVNIFDSNNSLVRQQILGSAVAGDVEFSWDGRATDGSELPAGEYRFEAFALQDGNNTALTTYLPANVNSVTVGANNSFVLNVDGVGQVALDQVKEIL